MFRWDHKHGECNISKDSTGYTGLTFAPVYSQTTNQYTSLPGITPTYDSDGRLTYDGVNHYAWSVDSKMATITGTTSAAMSYDAFGRMVEKAVGSAYTQIVYSPLGAKYAVMSGTTLQKGFIPLPTGATAVYTSTGLAYYRHHDHLGSSRLATTPNRTLYSSTAYAPFGEAYASTGTTDLSFTGQDQDTTTGMHDFPERRYMSVQGRWLTPDPAGLGAVSMANPQTWNRYAYVGNNPLSFTDPSGLFREPCYTAGCIEGGGGGLGGGGFNCTQDGVDQSCNTVYSVLQGGGAAQCPNNSCGIGTATPYQCLDAVCGCMSNQYVATHENEYNGILYSNGEWQTFLTNRVDAQQQALADAIVAANPSLSWQTVYGGLQYLNTAGGNANFAYQGNLIDLSFIPGYNTGGCEVTCRFGGIPSIHMPGSDGAGDPILHLDSGNPLWGFGLGAFVHGFVDVLLGNINPSVPMGPW